VLLLFHLPTLTKTLLISLIALLTLIGIMVRPFKLNEAMIAVAGAALLLIIGLINPLDALTTLTSDWNTFFFFLGMMSLSALAEAAGLFDWLAAQSARLARGSSKRLLTGCGRSHRTLCTPGLYRRNHIRLRPGTKPDYSGFTRNYPLALDPSSSQPGCIWPGLFQINPGPPSGPKSVGHVARFVLDHAPCAVLLVRGNALT
jgi:Arsenical pump membrane protein